MGKSFFNWHAHITFQTIRMIFKLKYMVGQSQTNEIDEKWLTIDPIHILIYMIRMIFRFFLNSKVIRSQKKRGKKETEMHERQKYMELMFLLMVKSQSDSNFWKSPVFKASRNNISSLILCYPRYAEHFSFVIVVVVVPNNLWNLTNNRLISQSDWKRTINGFNLILHSISNFFGSSTTNCLEPLNVRSIQWPNENDKLNS